MAVVAVAVAVVEIGFVELMAEMVAVSVVELEFDYYRRLCYYLNRYDNRMVSRVL